MNSSWLQGDASRAEWDLAVCEKHIVWSSASDRPQEEYVLCGKSEPLNCVRRA